MLLKIDMKTLVLALLSGLWAFIPILTSYSANLGEVGLDFVLLFGLFCAVGTVCIFAVMTLIFKSPFAAFGSCVVGWFCVSASYYLVPNLMNWFHVRQLFAWFIYGTIVVVLFMGVGYIIYKLLIHYNPNEKFVLTLLSIVIGLVLITTIIPIASYSANSEYIDSKYNTDDTEFIVNDSLSSPNIYWIHAESMVNEKTLEKYWGEETVGFTRTLEGCGFYVNQNAELITTTGTTYALAALTCPNYYDIYEEYYLSEYVDRSWNPKSRIDEIGSITQDTYRNENELLNSFSTKGYMTIGILEEHSTYNVGTKFENTYLYGENFKSSLLSTSKYPIWDILGDIDNELKFITYTTYPLSYIDTFILKVGDKHRVNSLMSLSPQSIPADIKLKNESQYIMEGDTWLHAYDGFIYSIQDSLNTDKKPKLVLMFSTAAHMDPVYDEEGNYLTQEFEHRFDGYYGQYIFSEKYILYVVEMIQTQDPNAVIVIQGDHGPHTTGGVYNTKEYTDTFGSDADVIELRNHVLSAIYIPEEYRTEDYKEILSNPLNIARYLVNNFVGENYEYK